MGWFGEQLKSRIKTDRKNFEDSFLDLSSVVLGKSKIAAVINNDRIKTKNAIEEILKYYRVKIVKLPEELDDMNEQMEYMLRPTGIMRRVVHLKGEWWKEAVGPMIGVTKAGDTVALLPSKGISGYTFFEYESGKRVSVNKKTADLLEMEAFCFYKPFPLKKLNLIDLAKYVVAVLRPSDMIMLAVVMLAAQLLALISPYVNKLLIEFIIPTQQVSLLAPFTALLLGVTFSSTLISITNSLVGTALGTKLEMSVSSASMNRLISMPVSFFKDYASGDLSSRVGGIQQLCTMISSVIFGTGLSALFSFVAVFQMQAAAPQLIIPGLIFVFVQLAYMILSTFLSLGISRKRMKIGLKLGALIYALFSGVQKIKLAGAERRAFSKWSNAYKDSAQLSYNPPAIIKIMPVFSTIISLVGTLVFFYIAGMTNITQANYTFFFGAYGTVSGAIMALGGLTTKYAEVKPVLEMVDPLLKTVPEIDENKEILTSISGGIEIDNVSFRYSETTPWILDGISLKVTPGQYVAVVGKTGCGKSTLVRLLLGFEKAEKGAVYYDGRDINRLDLKSLRKRIGAVMQNSKLFQGDVFSNIIISAPWLTLKDAWEAAKLASLDKDIEDMPMQMNTIISEGSGGISGGQKQRLAIARAIAPKPSVLIFDEATSALDNITQKQVSESLDGLKSTRIVIAHRLSTIKNCDRIVVLDKGKIIEDGTYNELIENKGYFSELVSRQQVETSAKAKEDAEEKE